MRNFSFSFTGHARCLMAIALCIAGIAVTSTVASTPWRRPVPDLIEVDGYPVEVHHVVTSDGFIIELHRIPPPRKKMESRTQENDGRVILMLHGLLDTSAAFVVLGPGKALAYVLHESGYDVWMMNARGTTYSMNHTYYSNRQFEFWDFSFHEIGVEDFPCSLDYVLRVTGQKQVDLLGFSMGTAVMLIGFDQQPYLKAKVRRAVAVAPAIYITHVDYPMVTRFSRVVATKHFIRTHREFPPDDWGLNAMMYRICKKQYTRPPYESTLCTEYAYRTVRARKSITDMKNLDFFFLYYPDTTSLRLMNHYLQIKSSEIFRNYDFGPRGNQWRYGSRLPPVYNISNIDVPVAIFSSDWDALSPRKDVERLKSELPNVVKHFKVKLPRFDHMDFIWGKDADKLLYKGIVDHLLD